MAKGNISWSGMAGGAKTPGKKAHVNATSVPPAKSVAQHVRTPSNAPNQGVKRYKSPVKSNGQN